MLPQYEQRLRVSTQLDWSGMANFALEKDERITIGDKSRGENGYRKSLGWLKILNYNIWQGSSKINNNYCQLNARVESYCIFKN